MLEAWALGERTPSTSETGRPALHTNMARPSKSQKAWLVRGLDQPGGKLPLFDSEGKKISSRTVKSCIQQGWAVPWFENPIKPDWLVCKLTQSGRTILQK